MSDTIELAVDTRELEAALAKLSTKVQTGIMRDALQAAGNVLLDAQVANAPERTDEEMPDSTALAPGMVKADLHTQIQLGGADRLPRVKVGPSQLTGHVVRWQNDGYNLTTHRSKSGRKVIKAIPGKHFLEAAFDESAETAVDMFLAVLADGLLGTGAELEGVGPESNSHDVEFG